ncbi:tumor necrosis factor alpha-induced protein 3-like [Ptychodera flava]|uniref:tumor necrosis factor alpha-induced protein 3-like n=1 Tax=Ptychodera flava TaxID=63121 RepID=UPI00396A1969
MVHAQYDQYRSPLNLPKKISESNRQKAAIVKEKVNQDVAASPNDHKPHYFRRIARSSIRLPPLSMYPTELQTFLHADLIDQEILMVLVNATVLNWCMAAKQLLPIQTTADGNCLMHAIFLAIWGIEDEELFLRRLLHNSLTQNKQFQEDMRKRWENERKKVDTMLPGGELRYRSAQWDEEWKMMIRIADPGRRPAAEDGLPYQCLDEFHIFVMANILRRPIIVAAENMWRDFDGRSLQPQNFGGIYLPLCWEPKDCSKTPVFLAYNVMHFTPLVFQKSGSIAEVKSMTADARYAFPIVKSDMSPMIVHFLLDQEERKVGDLLPNYLNVIELEYRGAGGLQRIQAVEAEPNDLPEEMDLIPDFFKEAEKQYHLWMDREFGGDSLRGELPEGNKKAVNFRMQKCQMEHCQNVGNWDKSCGICDGCVKTLQEQSLIQAYQAPNPIANSGRIERVNEAYSTSGQVSLHGSPVVTPTTPAENTRPAPGNVKLPSYDDVMREGKPNPQNPRKTGFQFIPSILPVECATENCDNFCGISTGKFCHACIKNDTRPKMDQICATENCMNLGNHLTEGLCKVCYDQKSYIKQGSARPSAPPPSIASQAGVIRASSSAPLTTPSDPRRSSSASASPVHAAGPLQSPEGDKKSNSLPVEFEDMKGPQKCMMPDCKMTGYPKFQGLCEGCYNQQTEVFDEFQKRKQVPSSKPAPMFTEPVAAKQLVEPRPRVSSEGSEPKLCMTRGCDMYGSPEYRGYCSQCFLTILSHTTKKPPLIPSTLAIVPEPDFRKAQQMQKCITPTCVRVGFRNLKGYCMECTRANIATAGDVQTAGAPAVGGAEGGVKPPTKFKVQKHICVNPGCEGVRMLSEAAGGLCYWCHEKATRTIIREPEEAEENVHAVPEEIPVAERCSNPKCDKRAISAERKLCERCLNVLEAAKEPPKKEKSRKVAGGSIPCATADCPNARQQGRQGFCRDCYHKYLDNHEPQQPPAPRPASRPVQGANQYPKFDLLKCQSPWGCDMFGDPDNDNLCSKCFQRTQRKKYQPAEPFYPAAYHGIPTADPIPGNAYDEPWGYRNRKCATRDCPNVGNPNILDGLCDECYNVYQDIRQAPRYTQLRELRPEPPASPKKNLISQCKQEGCDHFGNPRCFGYCNECYEILRANAPEILAADRLNQVQI